MRRKVDFEKNGSDFLRGLSGTFRANSYAEGKNSRMVRMRKLFLKGCGGEPIC